MVIHFLTLLVSMVYALIMEASFLPFITCSSPQVKIPVGQSKLSVLGVLGTKSDVQCIEVVPDSYAVLQSEKISYSKNKHVGASGWIHAIWTVVDLLSGQFLLTPVSGASITWSEKISQGPSRVGSSTCQSMVRFRKSLVGLKTQAIVVRAGSSSYKCSNANVAKQIIDKFSIKARGTFSCSGKTWSVGVCGLGAEINVASGRYMCTCDSAQAVVIRPCIGNDDRSWGGAGSKCCDSVTTTLSITAYHVIPPTYQPTIMPTDTPTAQPTPMPTRTPTLSPTTRPTVHADLMKDFDIIDKNGDGSLNYDEIAFAISDTNKDNKLSLKEYGAARADRILIDTGYTPTNSSVVKFSDNVVFTTDFNIVDKNGDGFLNYDEVVFAIADIKKDGKLSLEEYDKARADRILVDTSYKLE